ncbi:MAG: EAL domain-containing protein [Rubrivivax sp.]|nr:EAL domain-containing protein [Rubrivivax sp.]
MNAEPAPELGLRAAVAGLHNRAAATLRGAALALLSLLLAYAGALSLPLLPWAALALPAGLALAAPWRGGRAAWGGTVLGLLAALLSLRLPFGQALLATLAVAGATLLAHRLLRRLGFDARLERGADVAALAAAAVLAAAWPVALVVSGTLALWGGGASGPGLVAGWTVLALGTVGGAAAMLAFDRSLLRALQRTPFGWRTASGALLLLAVLALVALAPASRRPAIVALALCAAPLALLWLALRGQFALATSGWVLAGLLGAQGVERGLFLGLDGAPGRTALAAWLGAMLGALLLAQAATVQWRNRAQRWEWALDGSRLGVADWDLRRGQGFASTAWRSLAGLAGAHWSPAAWRQRLHTDDQPLLDAAIAALASGEAGRREVELRLPDPGEPGAWRWAEATLMVIERDAAGRPLRLLATLADIHVKRAAQDQQRMSAALFQHLHEGLLITDPELRVLDVNPAYTQILGVPRDELIGAVPTLLQAASDDPLARQQRAAMWAGLRDHGSWRGELLERRRDGTTCTLQTTISTVGDTDSAPRYHVLVISDITQQQAQRDQLQRQAHFDELTGLPNRTRLSQLLDEAMYAADREGFLLVVCYLDLDHFKPVNDQHGHAAGDRLLVDLAVRLKGALRRREHWADSAARLGGDEFVLLLRATTLEAARLAVERVLRVVGHPYLVDPAQPLVQVTASMGATVYPVDHSDADTLLRHADHAMYGAKQAGRNGYLFFDPEHRRRTEQRVVAIGRIQEALDRQEFVLHYQPKVNMRTGRVLGFEALLRWEHPQQGLVQPLQFLPLIETTGLSSHIGDWVISRALEHLAGWRRQGMDVSVSVNVSARHLQEPDFAQRLAELLARHPEALAAHLEIEMLETAAHADIEATSVLLARCQGTGVRFALDDFGTGYSTLTYLKRLPVDVLKIDRSFVHAMLDDTQDLAIVEGVIGLAGTFGCTVVAEGVENPAQARALLDLGCVIGQGTGIAAPMPVNEVAGWVRDYKGIFAIGPALVPAPPAADDDGVARLGV